MSSDPVERYWTDADCAVRTHSVVTLLLKRLSIRGWPCGSPKDAEDCLAFVQAKGIKCMVERFPLHKAQEAFDRRETARFRAVIVPST